VVGELITAEAQQQGTRRRPERWCAVGIGRQRGGQGDVENRRPVEGCTSGVQSRRGGMVATAVKVMVEQQRRRRRRGGHGGGGGLA